MIFSALSDIRSVACYVPLNIQNGQRITMAIGSRNQERIAEFIGKHDEFRIASMSAERVMHGGHPTTWGQLDESFKTEIKDMIYDSDIYVVYSYITPIGWMPLNSQEYGNWHVPVYRYSNTTSQHQSILKYAIRTSGESIV